MPEAQNSRLERSIRLRVLCLTLIVLIPSLLLVGIVIWTGIDAGPAASGGSGHAGLPAWQMLLLAEAVIMLAAGLGAQRLARGIFHAIATVTARATARTTVTHVQEAAERLEAEEARHRSQRLEVVGQLTGGIAHEFNNLLMAIGGCLDLLAPHLRGDRPRLLLQNALRATDRGASLTRQLLAFARRQHLNPAPVDLNTLVGNITVLLASTLGRSIEIETDLSPQAWPAMADGPQLDLVLLNLAINARDAMPNGGRLIIGTTNTTFAAPGRTSQPSRAELPPEGEYATLVVTDTGTGMLPGVAARAFEPFFTTKDVGSGSGLGLPQVLGVAQELGGGVGIDSVPGQGTTVRVFLPRAAQAAIALIGSSEQAKPEIGMIAATGGSDQSQPSADTPHWTQRRALRGRRLLLVDDDPAVRDIARVMLQEMGAAVTEASNGQDALLQLRTEAHIDAVLVDYTMPHMTGLELTAQIAGILPELPVVLMTGYSIATLPEAGPPQIRAVLQKPFRAERLAEVLLDALRKDKTGGRTPPQTPALMGSVARPQP